MPRRVIHSTTQSDIRRLLIVIAEGCAAIESHGYTHNEKRGIAKFLRERAMTAYGKLEDLTSIPDNLFIPDVSEGEDSIPF